MGQFFSKSKYIDQIFLTLTSAELKISEVVIWWFADDEGNEADDDTDTDDESDDEDSDEESGDNSDDSDEDSDDR